MRNKLIVSLLSLACTLSLVGCSTASTEGAPWLDYGVASKTTNNSTASTPDNDDNTSDSNQSGVDYTNLAPYSKFEYDVRSTSYNGEKISGYKATLFLYEPEDVVVVPSEYNGKPITDVCLFLEANIGVLVVPDTIATLKYASYPFREEASTTDAEDYVENVWLDGKLYPYDTFASLVNADLDPRDCDASGFLISEDGKTLHRYVPFLNQAEDTRNVVIPEGIEVLESRCFEVAEDLESIQLPSTLARIGYKAFYNSKLSSISLPAGLEEIESSAFEDSKLTSIVLPEGLKKIGSNAFSSCSLTGDLVIPDSVTEIGSDAFWYNEFTSITLGSGLSEITDSFSCSKSIKSLVIPANVTEIKNSAFSGSAALESLVIEEGCEHIMDGFDRCPNLTSVKLPETLKYLDLESFSDCPRLTNLTIPDTDIRVVADVDRLSKSNPELKITYRGKVYTIQELFAEID